MGRKEWIVLLEHHGVECYIVTHLMALINLKLYFPIQDAHLYGPF